MKSWIISKFAKPVLPILLQVYKVLGILTNTLEAIRVALPSLGIVAGTPVFHKIAIATTALSTVYAAITKVITYLGGELPVLTSSENDIEEEVRKLKKLL